MNNRLETQFWERCWQEENQDDLMRYLAAYKNLKSEVIDIFKAHKVQKICDAACGFGAYSLAFASNGFEVSGFDISPTAVQIAQKGLKNHGLDSADYKVASILDTGYPDESFDGVVAHAVIDHLTAAEAGTAIKELLRITVPGGLVMVSFDTAEPEDFACSHEMLEPGTMLYKEGNRSGMIFHPYEWDEIGRLLRDCDIIYRNQNRKNEKIVVVKK